MSLNRVTVICDVYDGAENLLLSGTGYWTPTVAVTDSADHLLVAPGIQVPVAFKPTGSPQAPLLACDNAALLPSGWRWTFTPPPGTGLSAANYNVQAGPVSFTATSASPAVFTATAPTGQPWVDGMSVTLSGGSLPAGFTAGTAYYLTGTSGSTFSLAATQGGTAIGSSSTGSGDVTVTSVYLSQMSTVATAVTTYPVNPLTTKGDLIYEDATPTPARLPIGSSGQVLSVVSGLPAWGDASAASFPTTTLGDMIYEDATPTPARLAGTTSATKHYLTQTGTGTTSAAPVWDTIAAADVPTLNQSTTGNAATATNLAGGATVPAYLAPHVVTLTDAATIAVDASLGNDFRVTLGGNRTMGAPSNPADGQKITFQVTQDATGSRTLTWPTGASGDYSFGASSAPTPSTAAGDTDLIAFCYNSAKARWLYLGSALGF